MIVVGAVAVGWRRRSFAFDSTFRDLDFQHRRLSVGDSVFQLVLFSFLLFFLLILVLLFVFVLVFLLFFFAISLLVFTFVLFLLLLLFLARRRIDIVTAATL